MQDEFFKILNEPICHNILDIFLQENLSPLLAIMQEEYIDSIFDSPPIPQANDTQTEADKSLINLLELQFKQQRRLGDHQPDSGELRSRPNQQSVQLLEGNPKESFPSLPEESRTYEQLQGELFQKVNLLDQHRLKFN